MSLSINELLRQEYNERRRVSRVKYSQSPTRSFCSVDHGNAKKERRSPSPTSRRTNSSRSIASLPVQAYSSPRHQRNDPEIIRDKYGYNQVRTAPDVYAKSRASPSVISMLRGGPTGWDEGSIPKIATTTVMPSAVVCYIDSGEHSRVGRSEVSYRGRGDGHLEGESLSTWPRDREDGRMREISRVDKERLFHHDNQYHSGGKGHFQGGRVSRVDQARSSFYHDDRWDQRSAFSEVVYLGRGRGHREDGPKSVRSEQCYRDEVQIIEADTSRSVRSENVHARHGHYRTKVSAPGEIFVKYGGKNDDREQSLPKSSVDPVSVRRTKPNDASSVSTFGLGTKQFPCEVIAVDTFDDTGETLEKAASVVQILKYETLPLFTRSTDAMQTDERMSTPTRKRRSQDTANSVASTRSESFYRDKVEVHDVVPLTTDNTNRSRKEKTTSTRDEKCYTNEVEIIDVDTDTSVRSHTASKQLTKPAEIYFGPQGKSTRLGDENGQGLNPGVDIKQSLPSASTDRAFDRWRKPRDSSAISISGLGTAQFPCQLLDDDVSDDDGETPEKPVSVIRMENYETLPILVEAAQGRDSMSTHSNLRNANDTINSTRHVSWPYRGQEKEQKSKSNHHAEETEDTESTGTPPPRLMEDQYRQDGPRNRRRGRPPKTGDLLDFNSNVATGVEDEQLKDDSKPRASKKKSLVDTYGLSESTIRLLHLLRFEEQRLEASRKKAEEETLPKESAKSDDASLTSDADFVAGVCHQQLLYYFDDDFAEALVDTNRSCEQVMNVFTLRAVEIKSVWDHIDSAKDEITSTL